MTTVRFFEKTGCGGNARQKALLRASGHAVEALDIREQPWTAETLRPFFGDHPVAEWFNPNAPGVKSGEVVPGDHDETSALALMLADPLLIRRPLMEAAGEKRFGFKPDAVRAWIGLIEDAPTDVETCRHKDQPHAQGSCAGGGAETEAA